MALLAVVRPAALAAGDYRVVWVYDGDTVKVERDGQTARVRLVGIDAPETGKEGVPGQPYSRKAQRRLMELVKNRGVRLNRFGQDAYNRILAEVFVPTPPDLKKTHPAPTLNVNVQLVREGLAAVYGGRLPNRFDASLYREAEAEARRSSRGVWRQGDAYESPWQWKRRHRAR